MHTHIRKHTHIHMHIHAHAYAHAHAHAHRFSVARQGHSNREGEGETCKELCIWEGGRRESRLTGVCSGVIKWEGGERDQIAALKDMGWLPSVGSLKLYLSFAKKPYKRDIYSAKSPTILGSLLIVANFREPTTNFREPTNRWNFREPTNRSHHSMKECLGTALALCCSVVQCIAV